MLVALTDGKLKKGMYIKVFFTKYRQVSWHCKPQCSSNLNVEVYIYQNWVHVLFCSANRHSNKESGERTVSIALPNKEFFAAPTLLTTDNCSPEQSSNTFKCYKAHSWLSFYNIHFLLSFRKCDTTFGTSFLRNWKYQ